MSSASMRMGVDAHPPVLPKSRHAVQLAGHHEALIRVGRTLRLAQVPTQPVEAGGLLIALSFVGVCGTDLQILNGKRPDTAEILGHEGVGIVVQAGRNAAFKTGERVVFNPSAQLSSGRILGHNTPGLFQRRITVRAEEVDQGLLVRAPDLKPAICGALIEPLGAVIYAHELMARIVPELRSAAIFGAGPVGLLATSYLSGIGVKVLLIHPSHERLRTAIAMGLVTAASAIVSSANLPEQILTANEGKAVDAAIICTTRSGAPTALANAVRTVRAGGCIDLITNYPEEADTPSGITAEALRSVRAANVCGAPREGQYVLAEIQERRIAFTGHRGTSADHLHRAMQALREGASRYTRLITHVLSLHEAASAIPILSESGTRTLYGRDCIKAVIDMTQSAAQVSTNGAALG